MIITNNPVEYLYRGVEQLSNAVGSTLGPSGNSVVIQHANLQPFITKDGVTVARYFIADDSVENIGATIIRDVAADIADKVGDATTTSVVFAAELLRQGIEYSKNPSYNVREFRKDLDRCKDLALEFADKYQLRKNPGLKDLKAVATVSSNGDEVLADLLSKAFFKNKKNTIVHLDKSMTDKTYIREIEGLSFTRGFLSSYFINNNRQECELENCAILIYDNRIESLKDVSQFLAWCKNNNKSALLIVREISDVALSDIIHNTVKGVVKACVVQMPSFGDYRQDLLGDMMIYTNTQIMSQRIDLSSIGYSPKVIVSKGNTLIMKDDSNSDIIDQRIESIEEKLKVKDISPSYRNFLKGRISTLTNSVSTLYIGASSEIEWKERKDRAEDTVKSLMASLEEGVTISIASLFAKICNHLGQVNTPAASVLGKALLAPITKLCANAGFKEDEIVSYITKIWDGGHYSSLIYRDGNYSILDGELEQIRDPLYTAKNVISTVVSIIGTLLTTNVIINNEFEGYNN